MHIVKELVCKTAWILRDVLNTQAYDNRGAEGKLGISRGMVH